MGPQFQLLPLDQCSTFVSSSGRTFILFQLIHLWYLVIFDWFNCFLFNDNLAFSLTVFPASSIVLFGDESGLTVEIRIGKEPCGTAGVVKDIEVAAFRNRLVTRVPLSDNLFEFRHGFDDTYEHYVPARWTSTPVVNICDVVTITGTSVLRLDKTVEISSTDLSFVGHNAERHNPDDL